MDKESGELAKAALGVFTEELSPMYDDIRSRLVGHLAANDIQLGDMRTQEVIRRNNYALVAEFVASLPGEKPKAFGRYLSTAFAVNDA